MAQHRSLKMSQLGNANNAMPTMQCQQVHAAYCVHHRVEQQGSGVQPVEGGTTVVNISVHDSAHVTAIAGNVGRDAIASGSNDRPK
jgi:hypothetical protein